jgi:hypothetical protein
MNTGQEIFIANIFIRWKTERINGDKTDWRLLMKTARNVTVFNLWSKQNQKKKKNRIVEIADGFVEHLRVERGMKFESLAFLFRYGSIEARKMTNNA